MDKQDVFGQGIDPVMTADYLRTLAEHAANANLNYEFLDFNSIKRAINETRDIDVEALLAVANKRRAETVRRFMQVEKARRWAISLAEQLEPSVKNPPARCVHNDCRDGQ